MEVGNEIFILSADTFCHPMPREGKISHKASELQSQLDIVCFDNKLLKLGRKG
jgi:hypothetical protein